MRLVLTPHPLSMPSPPPFDLWANVDHAAGFGAAATLNIWFGIAAPMSRFVIPQAGEGDAGGEPKRVDGLWKTSCFEAFLQKEGDAAYREWNFAPSGDWAAYDFKARRDGMEQADIAAPPYIRTEDNFTWWALGATVALDTGHRWRLGLSAVLEEADGTLSHWALRHADGPPDFHHPDCFAAHLA